MYFNKMLMERNGKQLEYLAAIFNNLGTVFVASMVVPLIGQAGVYNAANLIFGSLYAAVCWRLGFYVLKKED